MKKMKNAKKDIVMVVIICVLISIASVAFIQNKKLKDRVAYSVQEVEDGFLLDEPAIEESDVNEPVIFTPTDNVSLKATVYSLSDVYSSIKSLYGVANPKINKDLNVIYQDFYSYFPSTAVFINMYGEKYTYDEYMFVKTYHVMRNNEDIFGLYLTTYDKCQTFSYLTNHSRDDQLSNYCEK